MLTKLVNTFSFSAHLLSDAARAAKAYHLNNYSAHKTTEGNQHTENQNALSMHKINTDTK